LNNKKLENANIQINAYNKNIENLTQTKQELTNQVWKFITENLKSDYNTYKEKTNKISNTVIILKNKVSRKEEIIKSEKEGITKLEETISNTNSTKTKINKLLKSYGFLNFKLSNSDTKKGEYTIKRQNGENAITTLSEGEKNIYYIFIFL
jgi:wobble nucleotide-excising tRNase